MTRSSGGAMTAEYRAWIQTFPSCIDGKSYSEWIPELGEWCNPACHVRRAGRSGTAYKEPFAEIPLTNAQHAYQHDHGELACLVKFTRDPQLKVTLVNASPIEAERIAADWFASMRSASIGEAFTSVTFS